MKIDLNKPEYYVNRELSWLVFNDRVLQEAQDRSVPLMQRLSAALDKPVFVDNDANVAAWPRVRLARPKTYTPASLSPLAPAFAAASCKTAACTPARTAWAGKSAIWLWPWTARTATAAIAAAGRNTPAPRR